MTNEKQYVYAFTEEEAEILATALVAFVNSHREGTPVEDMPRKDEETAKELFVRIMNEYYDGDSEAFFEELASGET